MGGGLGSRKISFQRTTIPRLVSCFLVVAFENVNTTGEKYEELITHNPVFDV
jgi:hypothetical protein